MKIKMLSVIIACSILTACASTSPTKGEKMLAMSEQTKALAGQWTDGEKLIANGQSMSQKGAKLVKEGKDQISEGKDNVSDGNKMIKEGKQKIAEGNRKKAESETNFSEKVSTNPLTETDNT